MKDRERTTLTKLNGTMVKVLLHQVPRYRLRWHRRGRKFNSCRAHQKFEQELILIANHRITINHIEKGFCFWFRVLY